MPAGNLENLIYTSQTYSVIMQKYFNFFVSLFGNKLASFGYEKIDNNGYYVAFSNQPKIAEIFIETKAYQNMQFVAEHFLSVEQGFVYSNEGNGQRSTPTAQLEYNKFRTKLLKDLGIYATFYMLEHCLNHKNIFVWNFEESSEIISLTQWENQILQCFMRNIKIIQYTLNQFKQVFRQNICKKVTAIQLLKPVIKTKVVNSTSIIEENLVKADLLTKSDCLCLKNIVLSNKETWCIYFYLQGMSAKEIAEKIFVSRRTVEDHIHHIKQKLQVGSRSELYEVMQKIELWKNIL